MASRRSKSTALASAMAAILWSCIQFMASAELQRVQQPAKMDGSLSLLVVGDWGRRGLYNQSQIAVQMGRIGGKLDIDFVISTGDNFYHDGLSSVADKLFDESFTNIYTAKSLQKPWYAVLGNHDYHGNTEAELSPILRTIDNRWFCMRSYILDAEFVEFFFIDTTPFVMSYWTDSNKHYNWKGVAPRDQYISNLLKDLDGALKTSSAKWKFVVGHHTMRSVSNHGDTKELIEVLLPILKANDVDMYINGHDHCLEHISSHDSPLQFFTSGGGSKAWKGIYRSTSEKLQFFYDGQGFMSMQLTETDTKVAFYDISGNVLHQWSMSKQLYSSM